MGAWETLPGETPIEDTSGVKQTDITTRAELNRAEGENIRKAVVKYLAGKPSRRSAPFDLDWVLRLHREMLGDVWVWAGSVRSSVTDIGVGPQQIEVALQGLLDDLGHWREDDVGLLEQAVRLHHRAVHIHPFENGNGRWARLLANIWLKRHDHGLTKWPEETIGTESVIRGDYITAIKAADNGDLGPLLELHRRYTVEA
ncbi:MAG: mobile mystery protein B [Planctomycetota bacterium]|jgi:Fic-DOC domain mobile mystery protein B